MKEKVKRNPKKPYEDMEGNWIGLGKESFGNQRNKSEPFKPNMEDGELDRLQRECKEGNEEACKQLKLLEEYNEEHLKRLMAIADHDEEPPKLKEPTGDE